MPNPNIIQFKDINTDASIYPVTLQEGVVDSSGQNLFSYIAEYNISLHKKNSDPNSSNNDTSLYTLQEAINQVPTEYRNSGLKLTFNSSATKVETYMCTNPTWTTDVSKWDRFNNVTVSQNTSTGHTDISVGGTTTPVASVNDVYAKRAFPYYINLGTGRIASNQTIGSEISYDGTSGYGSILKFGPFKKGTALEVPINNAGAYMFVITDVNDIVIAAYQSNQLPADWITDFQSSDYYLWGQSSRFLDTINIISPVADEIDELKDKIEDSDGFIVNSVFKKKFYLTELGIVEQSIGTGWTKSGNTYSHSGNSGELVFSASLVEGRPYMVKLAFSPASAGEEIKVQLGTSEWVNIYNGQQVAYNAFIYDGSESRLHIIADKDCEISISEITVSQIGETGTSAIDLEVDNIDTGVMEKNLTGWINVAIGPYNCLKECVNASRNVAIGYAALPKLKNGNRNIGIGTFPLSQLVTGIRNIAIGADAMFLTKNASQNTVIGAMAMGYGSSADDEVKDNTVIGAWAMRMHQAGASRNVAIGYGACNYSGENNVGIGHQACYYTRGKNNVGIGHQALAFQGGDNNVVIGSDAKADAVNFAFVYNRIVIGKGAVGDKDNQVVLGNSQVEETKLFGDIFVSGLLKYQSNVAVADIYTQVTPKPSNGTIKIKVVAQNTLASVIIQLATHTSASYVTATIHNGPLEAGVHYFDVAYNGEDYIRFYRNGAAPQGVTFSMYQAEEKRIVFNPDHTITWEEV